MEATIVSYCKIKKNTIWLNGEKINEDNKSVDLSAFLVNLYRLIDLNYPKFFKMDNLCKLGILATELMMSKRSEFENYEKEKVAIVLSNNSSSMETDRNHFKTIVDKKNYFPSPAVFVYTLPNIIIGEIAIKHKFSGENAFFVTETFDEKLMHTYVSNLLNAGQNNHATGAVCGWVNVDANECEVFMYYVKKNNFNQTGKGFEIPHTRETIYKLYN